MGDGGPGVASRGGGGGGGCVVSSWAVHRAHTRCVCVCLRVCGGGGISCVVSSWARRSPRQVCRAGPLGRRIWVHSWGCNITLCVLPCAHRTCSHVLGTDTSHPLHPIQVHPHPKSSWTRSHSSHTHMRAHTHTHRCTRVPKVAGQAVTALILTCARARTHTHHRCTRIPKVAGQAVTTGSGACSGGLIPVSHVTHVQVRGCAGRPPPTSDQNMPGNDPVTGPGFDLT